MVGITKYKELKAIATEIYNEILNEIDEAYQNAVDESRIQNNRPVTLHFVWRKYAKFARDKAHNASNTIHGRRSKNTA